MTALERAIAQPQPVRAFGATSRLDGLDRRSVGFADVRNHGILERLPHYRLKAGNYLRRLWWLVKRGESWPRSAQLLPSGRGERTGE